MWSQLNQKPTQPLLIRMSMLLAPVPKPIATSAKIMEVNGFWFYLRIIAGTEHVQSGTHRISLHESPHKQQLAENRVQYRFSLVPALTICWASSWLNGFFNQLSSSSSSWKAGLDSPLTHTFFQAMNWNEVPKVFMYESVDYINNLPIKLYICFRREVLNLHI